MNELRRLESARRASLILKTTSVSLQTILMDDIFGTISRAYWVMWNRFEAFNVSRIDCYEEETIRTCLMYVCCSL